MLTKLTVALGYPKVSWASITDYMQFNLPSQRQGKAWGGLPIYHLQFSLSQACYKDVFFAKCSASELPEYTSEHFKANKHKF